MSNKINDIASSINVATMCPTDEKTFFLTLEEMRELGDSNAKAFTYYDGMIAYCLETRLLYEWKEVAFGENGIIPATFAYPPNTIVGEQDYSGRVFNFVVYNGSGGSSTLFFIEPSVNYTIEDDPSELVEAFHFGNMDIGSGPEDVALIKESFVSQSGYDIKAAANVGDEIKIQNGTNNVYLGHFVLTENTFNGYCIMTIIEKGDWSVPGTYNIQKLIISLLRETNYNLALNGNVIRLLRGSQLVGTVDLTALLGGAVGATIVSGVLDPGTGIVTFTMSDASNFDVDFSALLNAQDNLTKEGLLAPKSNTTYENLFIAKSAMASFGQGFYAADLATNYNSVSFAGFPYPSNRDYIAFRYNSDYYLMIKKTVPGFRAFKTNDLVLGLSFFKYNDNNEKSMQKVAYVKVLTRPVELPGLSPSYFAYPITQELGTTFPQGISGGAFSEIWLEEVNEANAYPLITQLSAESLPLRKSVSAPYTIKEEDNGRVLFVSGSGNVTVPALPIGFSCGFVQLSSDANDISFVADSGVTLRKPTDKNLTLRAQYCSAFLEPVNEYSFDGLIGTDTHNEYVVLGDLEDS